jgi:2-keto-4-pentenoate hydratase
MGHPFNALAWIAEHLAAHGRGLLRGDVVITGSIITSKNVAAADLVKFSVTGLGEVELRVD